MNVSVIIPVLNERNSIVKVLKAIPAWVKEIIVVDNGSIDDTGALALEAGAIVLEEPIRGYGRACLRGMSHLDRDTDIVVFLDGDYSDFPEEMDRLLHPIQSDNFDLVIGSRTLGQHEKGSLLPVARFGNWLSTRLIAWAWGYRYTDLGPFRAIRYSSLLSLNMLDLDFGWTVEMQVKALRNKLRVCEQPVSYRKRIGVSKVSGTIRGSFLAGKKILWTIATQYSLELVSKITQTTLIKKFRN